MIILFLSFFNPFSIRLLSVFYPFAIPSFFCPFLSLFFPFAIRFLSVLYPFAIPPFFLSFCYPFLVFSSGKQMKFTISFIRSVIIILQVKADKMKMSKTFKWIKYERMPNFGIRFHSIGAISSLPSS